MSLTAASTLRNVRVEDELWDQAMSRAADEGTTLSALIRSWLEDYAATGGGGRRRTKVRVTAAERKRAVDAVDADSVVAAVVDAINAER